MANVSRIHGGSSQETYRYEARWSEAGEARGGWFILRRAPEVGLVNAEHDLEYTFYSALAGRGAPVRRIHWLKLDRQWLERPFFIMEMAPGKPGHFFMTDDPCGGQADAVGRNRPRHLACHPRYRTGA